MVALDREGDPIYYMVALDSEAVALKTVTKMVSRQEEQCKQCWLNLHCFDIISFNSEATFEALWCAPIKGATQSAGYLFGGLYMKQVETIVTQTKMCPPRYYALSLLQYLHICVSNHYKLGTIDSLPFAGFFS